MNSSGNNSGAVGFKVNSGGDIYFPYVGRVAVGGATTEEIRVRLARLMGAFLKSPQITVDVAQFNSQKYELTGAVMKPGLYPVTDQPLKVSQAIALAGGVIQQLPNAAAIGGVITRPLGDLSRVHYVHDGKTTILNLRALYRDGDATQDRLVCAGDAIQVPDNAIEQVHVMGEVHAPGNYPLDTGELNLAQVLGDAGGLDLTSANASRIFVFRGTYQEPQIFWLDARSVDSMLLANRFELEPQDIVYVATAGLTSWDRIVSQILPTIESVYETKVLVSP
jgi:polysaccharide export outer membrane protein